MFDFTSLKGKVSEITAWLTSEFATIRTGRATPAILDAVLIDSYGSRVHINQVASISVEDPKTLRVSPWDVAQIKNIEAAIRNSDLGLSVNVDDKGLRVIFPELTSDRRVALVKLLKQKHEEARISLRKERETVWEEIQEGEKSGKIVEDDKFRLKDSLQKIIDEANKNLDELAGRKEKDITEN